MRGGSQPHLIRTSEGWYVVKCLQNPQSSQILVNEALGTELLRRIGISCPVWALVNMDENFLAREPSLRIETQYSYSAISPGWHFGSRFPGDPRRSTVSCSLTPALMRFVVNREDFFKVLVFDLWVNNRDSRQAIFSGDIYNGIVVQMIDNGYAFGFEPGDSHLRDYRITSPPYLPASAYLSASFTDVVEKIRSITKDDVLGILDLLPVEWLRGDRKIFERLASQLVRRGARIESLVGDTLELFKAPNFRIPCQPAQSLYLRLEDEAGNAR